MWIELTPHPDAVPHPALGLRAQAARGAEGTLAVVFEVHGDLARVRVPAPAAPSFSDGLWRHTCFEVFLARLDAEAYLELNLAPSAAWAAYAFDAYRRRATTADPWPAPVVQVSTDATRLSLSATLPLAGPSAPYRRGALRIGLTAVIEDARGISHWAVRHPPGAPDFHHPTVRTLVLGDA